MSTTGHDGCGYWIDALCINQADVMEKNSQVPMMVDIYKKANRVIAWLGKAEDDSDIAMDLIQLLADIKIKHLTISLSRMFHEATQSMDVFSDQSINAMAKLMSRPWWSRRWVVQEAVLGSELIFMCGTKSVYWACLGIALRTWNGMAGIEETDTVLRYKAVIGTTHGTIHWANIENLRDRLKDGIEPMPSLISLLRDFRVLHVSQAEDAIYALTSLCSDASRVVPDYHKTVENIYLDFACDELRDSLTLDLLMDCISDSSSKLQRLPSWVPDWTIMSGKLYMKHQLQICNAASGTQKSLSIDDRQTLRVIGVEIDENHVSTPAVSLDREEDEESEQAPSSWKVWFEDRQRSFAHNCSLGVALIRLYSLGLFPYLQMYQKDNPQKPKADPSGSFGSYEMLGQFAYTFRSAVSSAIRRGVPPAAFREYAMGSFSLAGNLEESSHGDNVEHLVTKAQFWMQNFIVTKKGYLGMAPPITEEGDIACVLHGLLVPVILRKVSNGYKLVGCSFILDMMNGEAIRQAEEGKLSAKMFDIV